MVNKDGQGHLSTSLTVGSGHVTVPDDHMTSPVVSNEEELEESNDLNTSEVSSELDLHCTQSCSALPDNVNYEHDINFPQSISAPVLPQRQREKPVKPESLQVSEPHQIDQGGSVKPQPEPVKPDWKKIEERELPPNEPEESEIHQSAQDELSQENLVIQQNQQREHLSPSADLENADTTGSPWRQKKEPVKLESSLQDLEEQMKLELSQQKQDEPVDTKLDLEESELPNGTEEDLGSISAAIAPGVQKVCQVVLEEPVKPVSSRQGEGEGINHELLHEDQEEPQANQGELIKPAERVKESEGSEKAFRDDVRVAADTDRTSNAVADHSPSVDVFQRETSTSSELAEGDTPPTVEANSNQDSFALGQLPPATVSTGEDTLTRHIAGEVEASLSGHESTNHSMVPQAEEEGGGEVLPVEASQQDDTVPCEVDSSVTVPPAKERVSDVTSLRVSDPSLSSKLENKELHPSHNDSPSKPHPSHSDSHSSASPSEPHPSLSEPHPSPGEPYLSPGEPHPSPSDSHSELPLERTLKILEERSQALVESLSSPLTSSPAMPHESLDASESSPPPGDDSSASLRLVSLHSDSSPKAEHCTSADITVTSNDRGDSERILLEPPWSPGTEALASDIQNLLSVVQAPLAANQVVKVPSISRNNRYYRVSVKGSTPKSRDSTPKAVRRNLEDEMEKVQRDEDDVRFTHTKVICP